MIKPWFNKMLVVLVTVMLTIALNPAFQLSALADPGGVTLRITELKPYSISASGNLEISGEITNHSPDTVTNLSVRLWRDATPLQSADTFATALANPHAGGAAMLRGHAVALLDTLHPGQSKRFTLSADLGGNADELLYLSIPSSTYQVGIEALGTGLGGYQVLATADTFVSYPTQQQVPSTTFVLLHHRPTLLPLDTKPGRQPVFADDSLITDLPGELTDLLKVAQQRKTQLIIDPRLYTEVQAIASGHFLIKAKDGQLIPGTPEQAKPAADWLVSFEKLRAQDMVWRCFESNPDFWAALGQDIVPERLVSQTAANKANTQQPQSGDTNQDAGNSPSAAKPSAADQETTALTGTGSATAGGLSDLPLVLVDQFGQLDTDSWEKLSQLHPDYVLTSAINQTEAKPSPEGPTFIRLDTSFLTRSDSSVTQAGNYLAGQFTDWLSGKAAGLLITDSAQLADLPALQSWQQLMNAQDFVARFAPANDQLPQLFGHPANLVGVDFAAKLTQTEQLISTWQGLIAGKDAENAAVDSLFAGAFSQNLTHNDAARIAWLDDASAYLKTAMGSDAIQLKVTNWVTTSAEDNQLPATITNNGSDPIRVRIRFISDNEQRLKVADSPLVTVDPGESVSVKVRPTSKANGKVAVTAYLETADGQRVGGEVRFVVTSTQVGKVAWLMIVGSGVVFVAVSAARIRKIRRDKGLDKPAEGQVRTDE